MFIGLFTIAAGCKPMDHFHAYVASHGHKAQPCTRTPSQIPNTLQSCQTTARLLTTTKTKDQMESRLLLDVVVTQRTAVLQLLTSKDQSLLVRWDTLLILDL
jgi:hypothetical protein